MKIVADQHIPYVKDYFADQGELILKPGREISNDDLKYADILLVRSITRVDEKLLANTPVEFVGSMTAGADHLDTKWLDQAGIAWGVAAGFNAPPVADYVLSVLAALSILAPFTARKKTAAVIGVGNVGRLVCQLLTLLNYEVINSDPLRAQMENGFVSTAIEEIADVDVITLHVPLTQGGQFPTHHFINQSFLARQRPDTILINTSRGAVINSHDLLQYGKHLTWCFDVWEHEPQVDKCILQRAAIATPHIAGYSVQSKARGIAMIYQMLQAKNLLTKSANPIIKMPEKILFLPGKNLSWQDIVLEVFNPQHMTATMRATLLNAQDTAKPFDEMRHQFIARNEFAFTHVKANVSASAKNFLEKLGFIFHL